MTAPNRYLEINYRDDQPEPKREVTADVVKGAELTIDTSQTLEVVDAQLGLGRQPDGGMLNAVGIIGDPGDKKSQSAILRQVKPDGQTSLFVADIGVADREDGRQQRYLKPTTMFELNEDGLTRPGKEDVPGRKITKTPNGNVSLHDQTETGTLLYAYTTTEKAPGRPENAEQDVVLPAGETALRASMERSETGARLSERERTELAGVLDELAIKVRGIAHSGLHASEVANLASQAVYDRLAKALENEMSAGYIARLAAMAVGAGYHRDSTNKALGILEATGYLGAEGHDEIVKLREDARLSYDSQVNRGPSLNQIVDGNVDAVRQTLEGVARQRGDTTRLQAILSAYGAARSMLSGDNGQNLGFFRKQLEALSK